MSLQKLISVSPQCLSQIQENLIAQSFILITVLTVKVKIVKTILFRMSFTTIINTTNNQLQVRLSLRFFCYSL